MTDWQPIRHRLNADITTGDAMTDAEDLLLEIANSMQKIFVDPAEHANWCVEVAKEYFVKCGDVNANEIALQRMEIEKLRRALCEALPWLPDSPARDASLAALEST
jgi:hypothetical protein